MPGTILAPYEVGDKVLHEGQEWINTTPLNVWEPGVAFWDPVEPQRARNDLGQFVGDNPATPENEAWVGKQTQTSSNAKSKRRK
jgi:hypothetical protein